jgi:hypothetical protein
MVSVGQHRCEVMQRERQLRQRRLRDYYRRPSYDLPNLGQETVYVLDKSVCL